jgi:hypothetical protein
MGVDRRERWAVLVDDCFIDHPINSLLLTPVGLFEASFIKILRMLVLLEDYGTLEVGRARECALAVSKPSSGFS